MDIISDCVIFLDLAVSDVLVKLGTCRTRLAFIVITMYLMLGK